MRYDILLSSDTLFIFIRVFGRVRAAFVSRSVERVERLSGDREGRKPWDPGHNSVVTRKFLDALKYRGESPEFTIVVVSMIGQDIATRFGWNLTRF